MGARPLPGNPFKVEAESEALAGADRIRAAIEEDHNALLRTVAVLVAKTDRRLGWPEVIETASDVLHEAVQEALEHAQRFDHTRSARAWIRGIAAKMLLNRRRRDARARRCAAATVLGPEAWTAALGQLCTRSADQAVAGRVDLEQALNRISPEARRAIECRYYQGLEGKELARALGVATPGAARVRVYRALQTLRVQYAADEGEVLT
jgi:RNA polymerase sigma factor (sigma-70 family)